MFSRLFVLVFAVLMLFASVAEAGFSRSVQRQRSRGGGRQNFVLRQNFSGHHSQNLQFLRVQNLNGGCHSNGTQFLIIH